MKEFSGDYKKNISVFLKEIIFNVKRQGISIEKGRHWFCQSRIFEIYWGQGMSLNFFYYTTLGLPRCFDKLINAQTKLLKIRWKNPRKNSCNSRKYNYKNQQYLLYLDSHRRTEESQASSFYIKNCSFLKKI